MKVISLGWGIQSWTLAAMAALGEIEADVAIFADTGWEKTATYLFARQWRSWLEERGLCVVFIKGDNPVVENNKTHIPAFTLTKEGGQIKRQCTNQWKIQPIRRWLNEELKRRGEKKVPGVVELLMGISLDEFHRMRNSDVKWIVNCYPLVDMRMTRADCVAWLQKHNLPIPPKSSCVFCPFQSEHSWQNVKRNADDWNIALFVDTVIRKVRPPYDLFLHRSMRPLEEAIKLPEEEGFIQGELFVDGGSCDGGFCFV